MEHRWGMRMPTDVDVRIFADPASAGWGRLRDISISGGFIETALKISALSTLSLTVPATGQNAERLVRALVVRSDVDGVGVEWFDGDSGVVLALMQEAATWRALTQVTDRMHVF